MTRILLYSSFYSEWELIETNASIDSIKEFESDPYSIELLEDYKVISSSEDSIELPDSGRFDISIFIG